MPNYALGAQTEKIRDPTDLIRDCLGLGPSKGLHLRLGCATTIRKKGKHRWGWEREGNAFSYMVEQPRRV